MSHVLLGLHRLRLRESQLDVPDQARRIRERHPLEVLARQSGAIGAVEDTPAQPRNFVEHPLDRPGRRSAFADIPKGRSRGACSTEGAPNHMGTRLVRRRDSPRRIPTQAALSSPAFDVLPAQS